jgi:sulfate transport system ATP-binding protein
MDIRIESLSRRFGSVQALERIDLHIAHGELVALLGPSGSGKTTLLRAIAGLEPANEGRILFGELEATHLPVRERKVGFVFQHYALFEHMTVLDNVTFGLRIKPRRVRPPRREIERRGRELLARVQLEGLEQRYPSQLSGGQRQRVALARALAIEPRVLLLDEPFGALDAKVRKELRGWLRSLQRATGYTTVFVTHDQEEALELADRVVILNRGRIEQLGPVVEVYERPATPFVFEFLGSANVLPAVAHGRELWLPGAERPLPCDQIFPSGAVEVYVRPGDVRLAASDQAGVPARVIELQRTGPLVAAQAELQDGTRVRMEFPHLHHDVSQLEVGRAVRVRLLQFRAYPPARNAPAGCAGPGAQPARPAASLPHQQIGQR